MIAEGEQKAYRSLRKLLILLIDHVIAAEGEKTASRALEEAAYLTN